MSSVNALAAALGISRPRNPLTGRDAERAYSQRRHDRKACRMMARFHIERDLAKSKPRVRHIWLAFEGLPLDDLELRCAWESVCWYDEVGKSARRHEAAMGKLRA